jgi:hypothetical protein
MKLRTFWMALLLIALSFSMTHDMVLGADTTQHHFNAHTHELSHYSDADISHELHSMFHISVILPQTHQLTLNAVYVTITPPKNHYPKNLSHLPTYRPPIYS